MGGGPQGGVPQTVIASRTLLAGSVPLADPQREQQEFREPTAPTWEQLLGPYVY